MELTKLNVTLKEKFDCKSCLFFETPPVDMYFTKFNLYTKTNNDDDLSLINQLYNNFKNLV